MTIPAIMFETRKRKRLNPNSILRNRLLDLLHSNFRDVLPDDVPSKWEKHGDLVLLPAGSFRHPIWVGLEENVWNIVAETLKCKQVARKYPVHDDDFRSPHVELLKGSNGWVIHIDNKIKYTFDATKCMFSAGNISEKLRIAQFSCTGETVVDMYAGIGYFTLPFLVHAKASLVHACEWNPYAIEALAKNLTLNGVKERCIIHYGDNKEVCPQRVADRINLGLIPSSERGWETACKALKTTGGVLHVHGNVTSNVQTISHNTTEGNSKFPSAKVEWISWASYVCEQMKNIFFNLYNTEWTVNTTNISRIKSYAPHIDHLVIDIMCIPCKDIKNS